MDIGRRLRSLLRPPSGRLTNLQVFLAVAITFATGVGAVATGSATGRWVAVAHGIAAVVIVLLIPWKTRIIRHGVRQHRVARWISLTLAALILATLVLGFGYATGLLRSIASTPALWWHVALALALVPLLLWHLAARWIRPRRTDASRRVLLRAGLLAVAGAGVYAATAGVVTGLKLPGASRRFTGSYETGSFTPTQMPNTIWLDDDVPALDTDWRLAVVDARGSYEVTLADLVGRTETWRATLDCTSGWFAHQDWTGVPVTALLRDIGEARSLLVQSTTGYWVRLPVRDLDSLLLATEVGGAALSVGHGYPLRLVATGRRGYWWVKWVDRIELQTTPWWWQPLFPVT
jgi:DMSO/TMAO reductase YedYZ molybdopterin-dependent catalytic subunit